MPPWDQLKPEDEILELLHDIAAAERLIAVLAEGSPDRVMVQRTVDRLNARVLTLIVEPHQVGGGTRDGAG